MEVSFKGRSCNQDVALLRRDLSSAAGDRCGGAHPRQHAALHMHARNDPCSPVFDLELSACLCARVHRSCYFVWLKLKLKNIVQPGHPGRRYARTCLRRSVVQTATYTTVQLPIGALWPTHIRVWHNVRFLLFASFSSLNNQ